MIFVLVSLLSTDYTRFMKIKLIVFITFMAAVSLACTAANNSPASSPKPAAKASPSPTPVPTSTVPKNGDYDGKGVVTKINLEMGSVEMDHEEIKGVMPPMRMEFFVSDKKMLDGLKIGDKVDFVLRYKDHTETVVQIKKVP